MTGQINAPDLNLAATLECGQAFRWHRQPDGWFSGVVGNQAWRLRLEGTSLRWETVGPTGPGAATDTAAAIARYLSLDRCLPAIVATFPAETSLQRAVRQHWGLRVLRQEPWETLASFIASSTKQIVQIRQIVENLARRFGQPRHGQYSFPAASVLARARLPDLLACKLGFRAKYLLAAAQAVDRGQLDLNALARWEQPRALEELTALPGVGPKIANCVLLFGCGHDAAFPVDVWMARSLRRIRKQTVFGPYAGWAQQYLFYAERLNGRAAARKLKS